MSSLQDQLLQAGLVDKKSAKKIKKEQSKKNKAQIKSKQVVIDETKQAVQKAQQDKIERDREANRQKQKLAEEKAIRAQIIQLIKMNKLPKDRGDIGYNFSDGSIKKIYVTQQQQDELSRGRLAIVKLSHGQEISYEMVAKAVADKISERDQSFVITLNTPSKQSLGEMTAEEEEWYADYEIPDDLMW